MVRYSLRCSEGHGFESWFASAKAYDDLAAGGHLACAECGTARVEKALMAPAVRAEGSAPQVGPRMAPPGATPGAPPANSPAMLLAAPANPREAMLAKLRRHVEETSDYVGPSFAAEARRMHEGEAPERSIWGEARPDEARALIEDGIPVAPLPFVPKRRAN